VSPLSDIDASKTPRALSIDQHPHIFITNRSYDTPIYNWYSDQLQKHEVFLLVSDPNGNGYQIQTMNDPNSKNPTCVIGSGNSVKTGDCNSMTWDIQCAQSSTTGKVSKCTIQVYGHTDQYATTNWGQPDGYDSVVISTDNTKNDPKWQLFPLKPQNHGYAISWDYGWLLNFPYLDYSIGKELYVHWDTQFFDNERFVFFPDSTGAFQWSPQYHPDLCVGLKDTTLALIKCTNGADGYPGLWWIECETRDWASFKRCTISQYVPNPSDDKIMYVQIFWEGEGDKDGRVGVSEDDINSKGLWSIVAY